MPTTITSSTMAVHTISFRGLAGAIFVTLTLATILYVIGFSTTAWAINRSYHTGLWESCTCGSSSYNYDWFRATQAMITIGLVGLLIAFILICLYMCVHSISKNTTIIALVIVCFVSVLFMVIGFCIFGAKMNNLNWSFAVTVIASIFTLVAGVLGIIQMRQSGVRM